MALYEILEDGTIVPKAGKTVGNLDCLRTKVLWTNNNPTVEFASQQVTLTDSNYDYLLFVFATNDANAQYLSYVTKKGKGVYCSWTYTGTSNAREVTYVNDTTYSFGDANANGSTANYRCIPIQIIGLYKQPAMIYTGKELFAGDGVHIDNGVISGLKSEIVWSGRNGEHFGYLETEITMDLDLSKYKFVEFFTTIGQTYIMDMSLLPVNKDPSFHIVAEQYYNGSWHAGVKCQAIYYVNTKTLKWNGNYIGLIEVKGWW